MGKKRVRTSTTDKSPMNDKAGLFGKSPVLWLVIAVVPILIASVFYSIRLSEDSSGRNKIQSNVTVMYDVVDIPGKGKGMVAARDIKQGELVIKERPLLVVPTNLSTALLGETIDSWTPEEFDSFFTLSHRLNLDPTIPENDRRILVAEAIIRNNAVSTGPGELGIFPTVARLNHACAGAFNMLYHWREREGELRVYAMRDVHKGEEMTIMYMDSRRTRSERTAYLEEAYGFSCTCAVCSLSEEESRKRDERLVEMKVLNDKFETWNLGMISGQEAIELARRIWGLYEEAEYIGERGRLAEEAAYVAAAHGDESATIAWSRLAYKWASIELGDDSDRAERSWKLITEPRTHHAWGTRERVKVDRSSIVE